MKTNYLTVLRQTVIVGAYPDMDEYERRKLGIFYQINVIGLLSGILIPIAGFFNQDHLPLMAWLVSFSPAVISGTVLFLLHRRRYELGKMIYFMLYPVITVLVYAQKIDLGLELFFLLYGVLSIFFLQQFRNLVITFLLSLCCYCLVFLFWRNYTYQLAQINYLFYVFNHLLAIGVIFYFLFFFKKESYQYQQNILNKNEELVRTYLEIAQQKEALTLSASALKEKSQQLAELNTLKDKLFSVIAHDLRTPMYALRNLFVNIQRYDISGEEIKTYIPDVVKDLHYTTNLMENLLAWAKSQIRNEVAPSTVEVSLLIKEVLQLLKLQADNKNIYLQKKINDSLVVFADREMVNLVLRNLISNAIKFTPADGTVLVEARQNDTCVEFSVQDTGPGMSKEKVQSLFTSAVVSSKGTANETGTGLGLMLCKEFLDKNGGNIWVESAPGKGSKFYFTLPCNN